MFIKELDLWIRQPESVQVSLSQRYEASELTQTGTVRALVALIATFEIVAAGAKHVFDRHAATSAVELTEEDSLKCFRKGRNHPSVYINYLKKAVDAPMLDSKVDKALAALETLLDDTLVERVVKKLDATKDVDTLAIIAQLFENTTEVSMPELDDVDFEIEGDAICCENTAAQDDEVCACCAENVVETQAATQCHTATEIEVLTSAQKAAQTRAKNKAAQAADTGAHDAASTEVQSII